MTPGIVSSTLDAFKVSSNAIVTVPGYHLGNEPQQYAIKKGYDRTVEQGLLKSISWPVDGYKLFDIACMSESSSEYGILQRIPEANYLALPKALFLALGGYEERFDSHGGGYANLDLFKRVCMAPSVKLYNLVCEGTFHQFHSGATTGGDSCDRNELINLLTSQYESIRGSEYTAPNCSFLLFGNFNAGSRHFIIESLQKLNPKKHE